MSRVLSSSDAFHAIAEGNRRLLLDILREGEQPVGGLVDGDRALLLARLTASGVLLDAGVVARRPEGRRRVYSLDAAPLQGVHDWTAEYESFWAERLARLRRRLEQ